MTPTTEESAASTCTLSSGASAMLIRDHPLQALVSDEDWGLAVNNSDDDDEGGSQSQQKFIRTLHFLTW